jgi:class 3 adenylate cyclase
MMEGRRERKVVTVLFADLVGFTARAEQLDPEDVEAILRPYHERLRRELERFGGTVQKFIGDAVMALLVRLLREPSELVSAGRRAEADEQLRRALAFYRLVGATRYVREGEALLAASA